ncbi:hypothetical protein DIT68_14885 [Brumimicrobium oceani]|uniref:DUF4199 domain-containing protein n=2 Tax=Brumimicrobium oceani TaxID=2100725 RepID=A0A2U2X0W6_9FLAO|nr:hypothetical protein DIT68_14885 [Brumimicrobium oceani]
MLGIYFLILDALGWADNTFLRLGNYIFVVLMINSSLKKATQNGEDYLSKMAVGVVTVAIAMTLGAISLFAYLMILQPDIERYISPVIAANSYSGLSIALFIQSIASSVILVFIMSQMYKNKKSTEVV